MNLRTAMILHTGTMAVKSPGVDNEGVEKRRTFS
jgi:hypothetical protein